MNTLVLKCPNNYLPGSLAGNKQQELGNNGDQMFELHQLRCKNNDKENGFEREL